MLHLSNDNKFEKIFVQLDPFKIMYEVVYKKEIAPGRIKQVLFEQADPHTARPPVMRFLVPGKTCSSQKSCIMMLLKKPKKCTKST